MMSRKVAVVIPTFKAKATISKVIESVGERAHCILVVDDACPQGSGKYVQEVWQNSRVQVLFHQTNQGVGAATITGYRKAIELGCDVAVKVDADLQMDLSLLPSFLEKIESGYGYVKGNRFYSPSYLKAMPWIRLMGNGALSFLTKVSSGYWNLMDPTNGYTAINLNSLKELDLDKIEKRFFFETDLLCQLNLIRIPVAEVPTPARYGDEKSNLSVSRSLPEFLAKNLFRFIKRVFYVYFLRDFNPGSLFLVTGFATTMVGLIFGIYKWVEGIRLGVPATAGTGTIAAVVLMVGLNLLIQFIQFDIQNTPRRD